MSKNACPWGQVGAQNRPKIAENAAVGPKSRQKGGPRIGPAKMQEKTCPRGGPNADFRQHYRTLGCFHGGQRGTKRCQNGTKMGAQIQQLAPSGPQVGSKGGFWSLAEVMPKMHKNRCTHFLQKVPKGLKKGKMTFLMFCCLFRNLFPGCPRAGPGPPKSHTHH